MSKLAIYSVQDVDDLGSTQFFGDKDQAQAVAKAMKSRGSEVCIEREWFDVSEAGLLIFHSSDPFRPALDKTGNRMPKAV